MATTQTRTRSRTIYVVLQATLSGTPYATARRAGEYLTRAEAQSRVNRLAATRDDAYIVTETEHYPYRTLEAE